MNKLIKHSFEDRCACICHVCTQDKKYIKFCPGYQMIGDRACDTRHIPGYIEGQKYILCKFHIDYEV